MEADFLHFSVVWAGVRGWKRGAVLMREYMGTGYTLRMVRTLAMTGFVGLGNVGSGKRVYTDPWTSDSALAVGAIQLFGVLIEEMV